MSVISRLLVCSTSALLLLGCGSKPPPRRPVARSVDGPCTARDGRHCLDAAKRRAQRRRCASGVAASCEALARHFDGRAGRKNEVRAVALLRLACGLGSDPACIVSVRRRTEGASTAEAVFARRVLMGTAQLGAGARAAVGKLVLLCIGGDGQGCAVASAAFGAGKGVLKSAKRAHRFARLACAHGHVASCKTLASEHDDPFAEKLGRMGFAAACAKGAFRVCHHLGKRLAEGTGGLPKRLKRAHALQLKACKGGINDACYAVAIAFGYGNKAVEINTKQYLKYLILACKMHSSSACRELRTPNDQLRKACREQGLVASCALLKTRR